MAISKERIQDTPQRKHVRLEAMVPVIIALCFAAAAQVATPPRDYPDLRSADPLQRIAVYNKLAANADLNDPAYAEFLFDLLDTENRYSEHMSFKGEPIIGEGWSEPYYTSLLQTCSALYEKHPTPERFRRLAAGSFNPSSPFAIGLAKSATPHIDWLVAMAATHRNRYLRINALGVLSAWLVRDEGPAAQRIAVWRSVAGGLRDSASEVQGATVYLLERTGRKEALAWIEDALADTTPKGAALREMEPRLRQAATSLRAKLSGAPHNP